VGTQSILIVEDDAALRRSLRSTLSAEGLSVNDAGTGEQAMSRLRETNYAIVLLDLNMPGMGGMATCRMMRAAYPALTIIVLTVRDRDADKVNALDAGADDYITKPFQLSELTARIRAALRRIRLSTSEEEDAAIHIGDIRIDPVRHEVTKANDRIHLTPTEFDLLHLMMTHAGKPLSHRFLITSVWGAGYGNEREYLRTYMNQLRRKLETDPSSPRYLLTENYVGYRFEKDL
jgi:two-component system, OmpR family, KDP operon response regulator KdpE